MTGIQLNDIPLGSQDMYEVVLSCHDCGSELNRSVKMTGEDIHKNWSVIALTSGFVAKKCPKNCRATFSDLNINTDLTIERINP